MGCDGGSIPTRCELVKTKEKTEVKNVNELNRIKWFSCAISKEPLKEPIVTCALGHLYNKEAIITALLSKNLEVNFRHIQNLKDLTEIRFSPNPAYTQASDVSPFICPVTQMEVGGKYRFVAISECGCVISQRALREVPSKECLNCGKSFDPKNIINLNNSEEQIEKLRNELTKQQKQQKKKKNKNQKKKTKSEKQERDLKNPEETTTTATSSSTTKTIPTTTASANQTAINPPTTQTESKELPSDNKRKRNLPEFLNPTYVNEEVYSSIFTSSLAKKAKPFQETFLCRNVARA
jgi:Na+-translocating ferredoxin:NAD+ oxidoreductase RNF subunit RnfB